MARLFQVTIVSEDSSAKSPMQIALLNPDYIQKLDDATPGTAQTHILYKKHHGDTMIDILVNAPVSDVGPLINAANTTNDINTIQLNVVDVDGTVRTLDVAIENIWKVIDDPSVSAYSHVLMQGPTLSQYEDLRCLNTLAAIKALANA